jgi:hypothetical protein
MKLAFLAVLVVFLVLPLTYGSAGLGITDYDLKVSIIGQANIKVGKVTNTGNETLTFSYVWKQTNSTVNMTLPVASGENYTAEPGQSFEPTIIIGNYNESFAGNYSGIVEIKGSYSVQGGNAILPGATFHVSLIVNDVPDQQTQYPVTLVVSLLCVVGIGVLGLYSILRQRKQHSVVTSGPFRHFWRKL